MQCLELGRLITYPVEARRAVGMAMMGGMCAGDSKFRAALGKGSARGDDGDGGDGGDGSTQAETAVNGPPPAVRGGEVPPKVRSENRSLQEGGSWELGVAEEALVGPVDGIARTDGQLRREHLDVRARPAELPHQRVPERRVALTGEDLGRRAGRGLVQS